MQCWWGWWCLISAMIIENQTANWEMMIIDDCYWAEPTSRRDVKNLRKRITESKLCACTLICHTVNMSRHLGTHVIGQKHNVKIRHSKKLGILGQKCNLLHFCKDWRCVQNMFWGPGGSLSWKVLQREPIIPKNIKVGSLSARAKMPTKIFFRHVFSISSSFY